MITRYHKIPVRIALNECGVGTFVSINVAYRTKGLYVCYQRGAAYPLKEVIVTKEWLHLHDNATR
jgi:hypothetical protein